MRSSTWKVVLLVLAAGLTGFYLAREPWIVYQAQQAKANEAKQDMAESELDRAGLIRNKADAESSAGREKAARERGYVNKGEKRMGPEGP
jgi:hypothetical protein